MSKNYDSDIDWIYDTASSDDETDLLQNKNKRRGRPSIHEKYPEIITCVKTLIEQGSAEAHLRRRDSVMYTNGLSLNDIVMHVKKTLGITVSRHTIHRLMLPPRKKNTASKNYKCLIDARVPPKRNTKEKKTHDDFHFTCGQVRIVNEMGYLCKENTLMLSVDNKNKVDVGIPANSRRTKIRTFHLVNEAPNYNDHDFPNPNSKLVPAGYQILKDRIQRSRSLSPAKKITFRRKRSLSEGSNIDNQLKRFVRISKDKLNRSIINWPRSGKLLVQLYPSRLIESTNVMHVNHMINLIEKERKIKEIVNVVAIADGGPDWSVKGIINFMSMGLILYCIIKLCLYKLLFF
ncbi:uncharacterized protein LOC130644463 [Hydractinia symbiolongicarpus]|uniref:uncharacterized protein LOC130644463 n=1 Tax=Hydractinia symbiolongicarpus TaxID=13093 RepID=UPI00254B80D3|nr:uncharacterized protein LOC130644463 [Hydractinia symbiolongicarpus]